MSSPRGPIKWEKKLSASLFMLWIWNDHAAKWHLILITFKGIRSANFYNWFKNTILVYDLWTKGPESSRTIFQNIRDMTFNLDRAHLRVFGQRSHNWFQKYDLFVFDDLWNRTIVLNHALYWKLRKVQWKILVQVKYDRFSSKVLHDRAWILRSLVSNSMIFQGNSPSQGKNKDR